MAWLTLCSGEGRQLIMSAYSGADKPILGLSILSTLASLPLLLTVWAPRLTLMLAPSLVWVAISLGALMLLSMLVPARWAPFSKPARAVLYAPILAGIVLVLWRIAQPPDESATAVLYYLTFVAMLVPVGLLAGRPNLASPFWGSLLRANAVAALVSVAIALYEAITEAPLFAPKLIIEHGQVRAEAGQLHPIILGILLTLTAASASTLKTPFRRALLIAALFVGVWATNSQGPLVAFVLITLIAANGRIRTMISTWARAITLGLFVALGVVAFTYPTRFIPASTLDQLSANYRGTLLAQVPGMLAERPFGYGLAGVPLGKYVVASQLGGVLDLGRSLDSEPVVWAAMFGMLGLFAYFWLLYIAMKGLRGERWVPSLMLLTLMLSGLSVALVAWLNIAMLLSLLVALVVGERRPTRVAHGGERRAAPSASVVTPIAVTQGG